MEDFELDTHKPSSFPTKLFSLKEFKITDNDLKLRLRSNSCAIPSLDQLANCLDFVPKLK